MNVIVNVGIGPNTLAALRPAVAHSTGVTAATTTDRLAQTDAIIPHGQAQVVQDLESSRFRAAKLAAIRAEIEAGTYVTPERIHGTVSRLLDVVV